MLALLYLIFASVAGFCLLTIFTKDIFRIDSGQIFIRKEIELRPWMAVKPASFLVGTLIMTWITYIGSWLFRWTSNPMVYGNSISFFLTIAFIAWCLIRHEGTKQKLRSFFRKDILKYDGFITDAMFVVSVFLLSCFIMVYTFYIKNGMINVGFTVFSDFGPHLSVIRSFSHGFNFPTEYPHFPAGNIRYHFMFQFLAGNLEFLGLRIDWAFNIISVASLVSFVMLLHTLAVTITGKRWIGIITSVLFFFRSSLAFFTHTAGSASFFDAMGKIINVNKYIGRTEHEDWGLWAQNVYANQRHFAFSLGLLALIIILIIPLVKKMIIAIKERLEELDYMEEKREIKYLQIVKYYLFDAEMWCCVNITRAIFIGLILGMIAFWNGAVLIGGICILFVLAFFSASRLEYIIIAGIASVLSMLQSAWFIGTDSSPVKTNIVTGFLAKSKDFMGILEFNIELIGILIFIVVLAWFALPKLRWVTIAFIAPLVFANVILLTPDIAVNHKYVMISIMFLNIIPATFIYKLMSSNKKETGKLMLALILLIVITMFIFSNVSSALGSAFKSVIFILISLTILYFIIKKWQRIISILLGILLLFMLIATGVVDLITLYNVNKNSVKYDMNDPILKWVEENTRKDEIFLTPPYVFHPILLAGRKIFYGWPYFTWSAGYSTNARGKIYSEIYGGKDSYRLKELIMQEGIDYIVVEDENIKSNEYKLNEQLIKDTFKLVYKNSDKRIAIYECKQ